MVKQDALISVVIPAYNYAHTLRRAVESVISQLTSQSELLIINDGSTDHTQEVLDDLKRMYPGMFRVINQPNKGLAAVRNTGICESFGQYLIFLDADDEMAPGAIDALVEHIRQHAETRMVIGGYVSIKPNGKKNSHLPNELPNDPLARVKGYLIEKTVRISNGACAMHRTVFEAGNYPEEFRSAEDIPVFAQVLAAYPCTTLSRPLAYIHKHDDSLRHNVQFDLGAGDKLIFEVFDKGRLPAEMQKLRKAYSIQRNLSMFRTFAAVGSRKKAMSFYQKALALDAKVLFKWSYTRKALRLWINYPGNQG